MNLLHPSSATRSAKSVNTIRVDRRIDAMSSPMMKGDWFGNPTRTCECYCVSLHCQGSFFGVRRDSLQGRASVTRTCAPHGVDRPSPRPTSAPSSGVAVSMSAPRASAGVPTLFPCRVGTPRRCGCVRRRADGATLPQCPCRDRCGRFAPSVRCIRQAGAATGEPVCTVSVSAAPVAGNPAGDKPIRSLCLDVSGWRSPRPRPVRQLAVSPPPRRRSTS